METLELQLLGSLSYGSDKLVMKINKEINKITMTFLRT